METKRGQFPPVLAVCLFLLALVSPTQANQPENTDIRVLIDVSGSMKKNDPQNLRRSAMRLLVGLMPENTRAGVWTFGQYINLQVPLGQVDEQWKKTARQGVGQIHSRGLFTNIEDALSRATEDWKEPTTKYQRHVILLTDGMVDVSKDTQMSVASRDRILNKWLPRLKHLQAKIHTVALSDRADRKLMDLLAKETGGWFEQVSSADRLQRVFLRLFEQVEKPDTVPLNDNRFRVDKSIREVTLLVFRVNDAKATQVFPPQGKPFGQETAPSNVKWHIDEGYDLLTISEPEIGEWRLEAQLDPDNRVMVVTDLKMQLSEIPSHLVLGQDQRVEVSFLDQGRAIVSRDFLHLVQVSEETQIGDEVTEKRPFNDSGIDGDMKADDGLFSLVLGQDLPAGKVQLVINAEGKTFVRQKRLLVEIMNPATAELQAPGEQGVPVELQVVADLVNAASINIRAFLAPTSGRKQPVLFTPQGVTTWEALIDDQTFSGEGQLFIEITGKTAQETPFAVNLAPMTVNGRKPSMPVPVPEVVPEKPVARAPPTAQPETVEPQPEAQVTAMPAEEKAGEDWLFIGLAFGIGNLLLIGGGVAAFLLLRRRGGKDFSLGLEEDAPTKSSAVDKEAA